VKYSLKKKLVFNQETKAALRSREELF